MRLSNGLHLLQQSPNIQTFHNTVGLAIYFVYSTLILSALNVTPASSAGFQEITICTGDSLNITCPFGHTIVFTSSRSISSSSICPASPNITQQDKKNCTSTTSLLAVYKECYLSRQCYIPNLANLQSCKNNHARHLILKYTCINESHIFNFCDGKQSHQVGYDEEGVIFSPQLVSIIASNSTTKNITKSSSFCNLTLTPDHGQYLYFDLIPLSMEPLESTCVQPTLSVTAADGAALKLCPSTKEGQSLLNNAKLTNVTMSLEHHQTNQTAEVFNAFLITFKAQGCTTASIPNVNNVTVLSDYTYGAEAVIQCEAGLHKVSSESGIYTCDNERWRGIEPNCTELDCDPVNVPANSVVEYRTDSDGNHETHTTCTEGYALGGDAIRTCIPNNNTWNGSQPFCEIVNCGSLPTIPNGQVTYSFSTFGSAAIYTCIQGYRLIGSATRTCQQNSQWSGVEPTCSRIVCGHPGVPDNGEADPSKLSDYPTGTIISYLCYTGYTLSGAADISCGDDGSWSQAAPHCLVMDCGSPRNVTNAQAVFNSTTYGAQVSYTCLPGFITVESGLLICTENATWQGNIPECQEISFSSTMSTAETVSSIATSTDIVTTELNSTVERNTTTTTNSENIATTEYVEESSQKTTDMETLSEAYTKSKLASTFSTETVETDETVISETSSVQTSERTLAAVTGETNSSAATQKTTASETEDPTTLSSTSTKDTTVESPLQDSVTTQESDDDSIELTSTIPESFTEITSTTKSSTLPSKSSTLDTFPASTTTVQFSSTPVVSSVKEPQGADDSIRNGLIGGAVAIGVLLVLLIIWVFHIYGKRRKVRLKRPEEIKNGENGFFEKSKDFTDQDNTCSYVEEERSINSKPRRISYQNNTDNSHCTYEMNCTLIPNHKQNGSVHSNGSVPHSNHNSNSSIDNYGFRNEKCETSKI